MRVIFMGSPEYVIPPCRALAEDPRYKLIAVVCPPAKRQGRGRWLQDPPLARWIKSSPQHRETLCLQPSTKPGELIGCLQNLAPDVIITAAYGQILSREVLDLAHYGVINIHPSLLPRYRGATPVPQALLDGQTSTGISIIRTVEALDRGPIILSEEVTIQPEDTTASLIPRLFLCSTKLLLRSLELIQQPHFTATEQDESCASYSHKLTKDQGFVDFSQSAELLIRRYRAFDPWPGSYTFLKGIRVVVADMQIAEISCDLAAFQLRYNSRSQLLEVGCAIGSVKIGRLKRAGRPWQSAREFASSLSRETPPIFFSATIPEKAAAPPKTKVSNSG